MKSDTDSVSLKQGILVKVWGIMGNRGGWRGCKRMVRGRKYLWSLRSGRRLGIVLGGPSLRLGRSRSVRPQYYRDLLSKIKYIKRQLVLHSA